MIPRVSLWLCGVGVNRLCYFDPKAQFIIDEEKLLVEPWNELDV